MTDREHRPSLLNQLPQEGAMRLLADAWKTEEGKAESRVVVDERMCRLFGDGEGANSLFGIEAIAQTAAIAMASEEPGAVPMQGVLVQVSRFSAAVETVAKGVELRCAVSVELGLGGSYGVARGRMLDGETEICACKLGVSVGAVPE